jgi:hypothetical protein
MYTEFRQDCLRLAPRLPSLIAVDDSVCCPAPFSQNGGSCFLCLASPGETVKFRDMNAIFGRRGVRSDIEREQGESREEGFDCGHSPAVCPTSVRRGDRAVVFLYTTHS